jgi:hypothetical protein
MSRPKVTAVTIATLQVGARYICVNGYCAEKITATSFVVMSKPQEADFIGGKSVIFDADCDSKGIRKKYASDLGLIPAKRNNLHRCFLWSQELEDYLKQEIVGDHLGKYGGWAEFLCLISGTLSSEEVILSRPDVQVEKKYDPFGSFQVTPHKKTIPFLWMFA